MQKRLSFPMLVSICVGSVLIALAVGLWPMDFRSGNRVQWVKGARGLEFEGRRERRDCRGGGVIRSVGPLIREPKADLRGAAVTIELWIRAAAEPRGCRSRILSFYDASGKERFFIGQWRSHLLVRGRMRRNTGEVVFREIGVDDALRSDVTRFITICSGRQGVTFYLDGKSVKGFPGVRLFNSIGALSSLCASMGNNLAATGAWSGRVFGLAFYGSVFSPRQVRESFRRWSEGSGGERQGLPESTLALYRFDEGRGGLCKSAVAGGASFSIDEKLPFTKKLLKVSNPFHHPVKDLLVNFLGFVPIGLSFSLLLASWQEEAVSVKAVIALSVACGALLSFCIEWAQVYLPTRDSSLTDLLVNTLGATAGTVLWAWRHNRRPFSWMHRC